ncbi:hypothetical protein DL96DRAFT_1717088 [Flagelloscypha sp. PMI_526]|nr:hypothetical protein DL96DRAFT_1717088 [Flagelloscypha sp. PMI_526]
MGTELPTLNLTKTSILKPAKVSALVEVKKSIANNLRGYLSRATHRSPFLEESWLREEYDLCVTIRDAADSEDHTFLSPTEIRILPNRASDIKNAIDMLGHLLDLPVRSLPDLPMDVMCEIFKWAALVDHPCWSLSLVSSQVQDWVDPILFTHCTFGQSTGYPGSFFDEDISPRLQRCGGYVQSITFEPEVSEEYFSELPHLFPNTTTLIVPHRSSYLAPIVFPSVTLLHCNPANFDELDYPLFSSQHFKHLTTISFDLTPYIAEDIEPWDWPQLESLTLLRDLWLTLDVFDLSDEIDYMAFLKNRVIPHLPKSLELLSICITFASWNYELGLQVAWDEPDLHHFAAGLWDPRSVLLLSEDACKHVDQAVEVHFTSGTMVCDEGNRSKAMEVIAARI